MDSASRKIAWLKQAKVVNHATFHEDEPIITFSTVKWSAYKQGLSDCWGVHFLQILIASIWSLMLLRSNKLSGNKIGSVLRYFSMVDVSAPQNARGPSPCNVIPPWYFQSLKKQCIILQPQYIFSVAIRPFFTVLSIISFANTNFRVKIIFSLLNNSCLIIAIIQQNKSTRLSDFGLKVTPFSSNLGDIFVQISKYC